MPVRLREGRTSPTQTTDEGPSLVWLGVTVLGCSLAGCIPLDQALYRLGIDPAMGHAFRWQMMTAVVWLLAAKPIARRWSLADSEFGALGGIAAMALVTTLLNARLIAWVHMPQSPRPAVAVIELMLGMLPIHALMLGLISLVGSWTSARRQRQRAMDREATLAASVVRAELDALRTRLQPHFLLNALNTVVGLARRNDGERAADVAVDLGELLRFSLAESGDAVPFDAEREIVERYVAIEQARLGDRLKVIWDLDPTARTTRIPALMWQPLVENAIRHGISRIERPGTLWLRARRTEGRLELLVDTDGPDDAHPTATEGMELGGLGLGLSTVERRLELLYGGTARVTLSYRPGGSQTVLVIPVSAA